MKHFKATLITNIDHEKGRTTSQIYLAAETKIAAKKLASQYIFKTDGANCSFYKSPRLEEISIDEYLANTEKQTDITEEREIDLFCALLTIFGVQEEYDKGEIRDADELLANPADEPEIFEQYTKLREQLSMKISEVDKTISLDEIKTIAINLVECEQNVELLTQSTELSTEPVVISVENWVEVKKNESEIPLKELVDNCTNKELIDSVIKNIDDNIFSAFQPVNGKIMSGENITLEMLNGCLDALKPTESLIVRRLANSTYHTANGYSSTQIRLVQRSGLGALDWYQNAPSQNKKSSALLIGDAVHTAILEPEAFPQRYISEPELDLRTKDGKKTLSDFEAKNLTLARVVLKKEEFETIQLMRDSALAYPLVEELLVNGEAELSIFYRTEKGTLLKIRPDWLGIYSDVPFMLDVKTTDDVHDFGKSVDKFGYHLQAAFYRIIANQVFNLDIDFLFCAIGKRPECGRYPVQLGMLDEEDSEEGVIQVNSVIDALESGREMQPFAIISRPFWAKNADRKRREALLADGGIA